MGYRVRQSPGAMAMGIVPENDRGSLQMLKLVRAWCLRAIGVFASNRSEREISAELEAHLQLHIDDNIRAGMPRDEARRRAVVALGGIERTKEELRDRRGLPILESWLRDTRFGVRTLRKSPVSLSPRRHPRPRHRRQRRRSSPSSTPSCCGRCPSPTPPDHAAVAHAAAVAVLRSGRSRSPLPTSSTGRRRASSFEQMSIYRGGRRTVTGQGEPDAVATLRASANLLPSFGFTPTIGRYFTREEDQRGRAAHRRS